MRTVRLVLAALVLVLLAGCTGDGSDARAARAAASQAAEDRVAVEALASQAAADRAAAASQLEEAKAAASAGTSETVRPEDPSRPAAVGQGAPTCNGSCTVDHRLTRSFLPQYSGEQTLLLASSPESDARGNFLHAFLVDGQGRVLWEEHGFGWQWMPVDERFGIRFDEAGHVFFRYYVADFTYLTVLDTSTGNPRLVGSPGAEPADGFQLGEVVERPGQAAFDVRETLIDCPEGDDVDYPEDCQDRDVLYRWNGQRYVIR